MSSILATDLGRESEQRIPIYAIRWGAIFAGLAVGLSVHLLMMLLGAAGGLTALNVAEDAPTAGTSAIIAGGWNTLSMLVAAFVGGYVAARASGLKRSTDGMLHGAVSWAATTLVTVYLASSAIGAIAGGAFSALRGVAGEAAQSGAVGSIANLDPARLADVTQQVREGNRSQAIATLREELNLSQQQAARVVDGIAAVTGAANDPAVRQQGEQAVDTATAALWWLFGAVLLSLLAGLGGGVLGVRGAANRFRVSRRDGPPHDGHGRDTTNLRSTHDTPIRPELRTSETRYDSPRR